MILLFIIHLEIDLYLNLANYRPYIPIRIRKD